MAIKITENVRHNGTKYPAGAIINEMSKEDEKRLIKLGVAFYVKEIPVEEVEAQEDLEESKTDIREEMDRRFNAAELKEVALDLGIEFQHNISKAKLLDRIIELGKGEEALQYEFVEEE